MLQSRWRPELSLIVRDLSEPAINLSFRSIEAPMLFPRVHTKYFVTAGIGSLCNIETKGVNFSP